MRTEDLFCWILERENIRRKKDAGEQKPWTDDPILREFRFCNVYREFDAVTRWIAANWRTPWRDDPDLWFAMLVARIFNLPGTLGYIGYPVPFNSRKLHKMLHERKASGQNVFNAAYIVSTNGRAMDKIDYVMSEIIEPAWDCRDVVRPRQGDTLEAFAKRVRGLNGMASFMTGQIVADMKYVWPLKDAPDWFTWAASGPGSRRGLNRVMDRNFDAPWNEAAWHKQLMVLYEAIAPLMKKHHLQPLHAQDLQNCLCEFDKYERARLGQGRPKSKYPGAR